MKAFSKYFLMMILVLAGAPALLAATQNAVLYGTVYDAAGNPAAGVTVNLDNTAIGFARNTTTDSDGSYNFAEVPPAENYELSASRVGRKIDLRTGITVNVGDERVVLPPLKEQPVAATPSGEVVAKSVKKQSLSNETVSTSISGVITGEQLRTLPVAVNRNFLNLGLIPPNTHDVEQGSQLAGASFSVAGNRAATNNFLLDGADNVASSTNQAVPFQVNDSVQEFRVTSSTANAEYGRNSGGTVNVVTRRGGNGFHGNLFGYFNSDGLNSASPLSVYNGTTFDKAAAYAGPVTNHTLNCPTYPNLVCFLPSTYNDYVANAGLLGYCTDSIINAISGAGRHFCNATGGAGKNTFFDPSSILATNNSHNIPFDSKQFGANIGGPIMKDKLFFFGSYEGTRIDNPNPIFERVPSAFDRTYDPYGLGSFQFAKTDPNYALDQRILSLYPQSNVVGVPGVLEFFKGQAPNYTNVHNYLARSDYVYSSNTDLSLRYVGQKLNQLHDDTLPSQSQYPGNGILRDALNQNLDLTYTHTFSSAWTTEARTGFNRFAVDETPQDASLNAASLGFNNSLMPAVLLNGIDPQSSGGTPATNSATSNGAMESWSDFYLPCTVGSGGNTCSTSSLLPTLDGFFPFARLGAPLGAPLRHRDTTWFLASNTSWTHGRHSFKFGAEWQHLDNRVTDDSFARGFMYSGNIGEFTSDSRTCNYWCSTLFGAPNAFLRPSFDFLQQQNGFYSARLHSYSLSGFIQDSWRIHSRLTLNAGLRYEYFSPPQDKNDALFNFDPQSNGLVREGGFGVFDPYGTPCTASVGSFQSVPQALSVIAPFKPGRGTWVCSNKANQYSRIFTSDKDNFAPRVGLAWDVFGKGKTVARAGIGWFYDHLPASYSEQLMYNRPTTSPNSLFGVLLAPPAGLLATPGTTNLCAGVFWACGIGSTIISPAVQAASLDGVNPNSLYSAAPQPGAIYAIDTAHSNTPLTRQISATVQQQITSKLTVEAGYIGNHGSDLPVVYNRNFTNEANLLRNGVDGALSQFPIFTMADSAVSNYNSFMLRVRAADWHGLRVNGTYNWSHSADNASTGVFPPLPTTMANLSIGYLFFGQQNPVAECLFIDAALCEFQTSGSANIQHVPLTLPTINFSPGAVTTTGAGQILTSRYLLPQDPFNFLKNDRGPSDFNSTNRVVVDYTWEVPALRKGSKLFDYWQMAGVFTAQSGQPFTIFAGPIAGEITQRVNLTGPVKVTDNPNGAIGTSGLQLASASNFCTSITTGTTNFLGNFLQPAPDQPCLGNSGRNAFTGPNYINMNFAIQKGFPIFGEGRMLTFRSEFYNLFDRANYFNPISQYSLDGQTINPDFGKIKSAHEPRQIQLAVRFSW